VRRILVALALLGAACAKQAPHAAPASPPPTPAPTTPAVPAGGVVAMGTAVRTSSGSVVTVHSWRTGSSRNVAPGPGGVYETVDVSYCAGPQVQEATSDLVPLFSIELGDGSRVAPDNLSAPGEFGTLGTVQPGACKRGPLVFQVEGGAKPSYVGFDSTPMTKWRVP
jgi:hypothetical protein